jgi:hypothetical protein
MLFFIILIVSLIVSFVLPWWIVAIISFLAALWIAKGSANAFWSAFVAIFIVWILQAMFKSVPNDQILATRVANMLPLGGHWILLVLITGLIGGLVAGMAGLTGALFKKTFAKE